MARCKVARGGNGPGRAWAGQRTAFLRQAPREYGGAMPASRRAIWSLGLLTALNFLNYVDRQVLPAVLVELRADPAFQTISAARIGFLQSAFLLVYMMVSPLAGLGARWVARRWMVAFGVALWSLATVGSGLARSYPEMLLARAMIGFGEAGYATVAPALLSDLFPLRVRARVLALFYLATPVGSALGFLVGGYVARWAGWRAAFWVAGAPGLACALAALTLADPPRGGMDLEDGEGGGGAMTMTRDAARPFEMGLKALLASPSYVLLTLGTALWVFSVGALAFWLPSYYQGARGLDVAQANLAVGGIAVLSGIVGTVAGGFVGDAWARRGRDPGAYLKLSGLGVLVAAPLVAACPFAPTLGGSLALLAGAELAIFLNTGPLNTALVQASPPAVREFGVGLHVLVIHLLGDAISPPLVGALAGGAAEMTPREQAGALAPALALTSVPLVLSAVLLLWAGRRESRAGEAAVSQGGGAGRP
jgi:predicted MFS family arabinose efflux permease